MKLVLSLSFVLFLSSTKEHGVVGAPLSTKAPKSTKATAVPSSVPSMSPSLSMSPSAGPACGGTCTGSEICMTTYQQEGLIITRGGIAVTAPLADGTYRICPDGSGDCEVPNGYAFDGDTFDCRTSGSSFIQTSCTAADSLYTNTYACAEDGNLAALGTFETFTCPGDDRCLTPAPSVPPTMSPTPKSPKAPTLPKSATLNPTSLPTSLDSCGNTCVDPEVCMLTYQQSGVIIKEGSGTDLASSTPLPEGTYRECPSSGGLDCEVPSLWRVSAPSSACRIPRSASSSIQVDCTAADGSGATTYACEDGVNPLAGGTIDIFTCPNASDSRCAAGVDCAGD